MSEHEIQKAFCKYMTLKNILFYAVPDGVFLKHKKTAYKIMSKLKAEGFKNGVSDLCICEPTEKYHGLYIEMKTKTGIASPYQREWIEALNKKGYKAVVCKGLQSAIDELESYLRG